ncbi:ABC transporter ATP-binding protein [Oscillospiraceae bacterium PP1C4]
MSVSISIQNVMKKYDNNIVIPNLSVNIKDGEFFTLLGPSGCGKTTLLRMIAGFNSIESGTIRFDDQVINNVPIYKRNFGMVFQNYAIFPNMTVYRNVEYGLKNKNLEKKEIARRVEEILDVVQITQYKDRYPDKLSGGQQQRVALARAIVIHPQVLLMDEPLSNLDAKLRVEMRNVISEIHKSVGITTVYVTHDQEEALSISDRIAIMNLGEIQQIETPENIYLRPYNTFVANFIGHSTMFHAKVTGKPDGKTEIMLDSGYSFQMDGMVDSINLGTEVLVSVRPEEFVFSQGLEGLSGVVKTKQFLGKYVNYEVDFGQDALAEISQDTNTSQVFYNKGDSVRITFNLHKINIFEAATNTTLMKGVGSNVATG